MKHLRWILVGLFVTVCVILIANTKSNTNKEQGKDFSDFKVHLITDSSSLIVYETDTSIISITQFSDMYSVMITPISFLKLPTCTQFEQRRDPYERKLSGLNSFELKSLIKFFVHPNDGVYMREKFNTISIRLISNYESRYYPYRLRVSDNVFSIQ